VGDIRHLYSKFHKLSSNKNRLRFDKVTESLKWGTFLRHRVVAWCKWLVDATVR